MSNPKPQIEQILEYQQKPKWLHLPTKAIRVPEIFLGEIEKFARNLDNSSDNDSNGHKTVTLTLAAANELVKELNTDDLLTLKAAVDFALVEAKRRTEDRRLEQAILFLAGRCDGARKLDGTRFNGVDAGFGHWLADRIQSEKPLLKTHAEAALKMLQKYRHTQLETAGYTLPAWLAIANQHPEKIEREAEQLPSKRVEIVDSSIAVYAPYDSSGQWQKKAKSIEGYKFYSSRHSYYKDDNERATSPTRGDDSWRYPITKLPNILEAFPSAEYHYSEEIEGTIKLHNQQQEEEEARKREEEARNREEAELAANEIIHLVEAAKLDEPLPCGLNLFDHQKEAVKWLLAHRKGSIYSGGILADDMGLGKTISGLVAAKAMQAHNQCSIFVVCPASLKDNWLREAGKVEVKIEVFSWAKLPKPLETAKYLLIGDEAHYCQDERSQRSQKFKELAEHENCLTAWLLTGTPLKNGRPINLFPLLQITKHPLADDRWEYQRHYCNAHQKWIGQKSVWDNSGASHLDELAKKTEDVILRRTKKECLDLPPKIRTLKPTELEPPQAKAYQAEIRRLVADYKERAKRGEVDRDAEALVTLNYLRKVGSEYKVPAAIALAEELREQNQQVVIFTEYLESAKAVYTALNQAAPCELLLGETPSDQRQGIVDRFQSGESKVFVGTIKAGGVGLTLTAASNVILVDRPWTPGDAEQAEDRCHRIGQNDTVNSFWVQLGLIDEAIDSLLETKQERIELVLKGKRKTLRGLASPKELAKELLEIL